MTAMKIDLPYIVSDKDRRGNRRLYVRRFGKKVRLRAKPHTMAFMQEYNDGLTALEVANADPTPHDSRAPKAAARATLGWLMSCYMASAEFKDLADASRRAKRSVFDECAREPRRPDAPNDLMRDCPLKHFTSAHAQMLRKRAKPRGQGAVKTRCKHLSAMFGWAVENEPLVTTNPFRDVKTQSKPTEGYYTWTVDDVATFEQFYPIGTKPRLALALLLYSGARRQDMVCFGKQHIRGGWLRWVPKKMLWKRSRTHEKPLLPVLADIIARIPCGDLTFLQTEYGKAFTPAGFGGWFRDKCDAAGLPKCTAHGLRKAGATLAAENGATDRELMALFDWDTPSQAHVYTRAASQKRLAQEAIHTMDYVHSGNERVSHPSVPLKQITS